MDDSSKRKAAPQSTRDNDAKRKKYGNKGKWQVPRSNNNNNKFSAKSQIDFDQFGEKGIWVTCAQSMKGKAAREVKLLFDDYAQRLYNVKDETQDDKSEEQVGDIADSINKELGNIQSERTKSSNSLITEVRVREDCIIYFRCQPPIEPTELVEKICLDARADAEAGGRGRTRYINRLTPVATIGKAFERNLIPTIRRAIEPYFKLRSKRDDDAQPESDKTTAVVSTITTEDTGSEIPACTYAIRPNLRSYNTMKSREIIDQVAALIDPQNHKVDLTNPDKVILIELYQSVCGVSIVAGEWERLKRYNISELYRHEEEGKTKPVEVAESSKLSPALASSSST